MQRPAPNPYLRTKIMTASPEELRLMLYDGCLKFCRNAVVELSREPRDHEAVFDNFARAKKIVLELSTSLKHDINPELCEKLSALYTYIYRLLVDANLERNPAKAEEAVTLLEYERHTWVMLMEKNAPPVGTDADDHARSLALSSLSKSA